MCVIFIQARRDQYNKTSCRDQKWQTDLGQRRLHWPTMKISYPYRLTIEIRLLRKDWYLSNRMIKIYVEVNQPALAIIGYLVLLSPVDDSVLCDILFELHWEGHSLKYWNNFVDQEWYADRDCLSFQEQYFDDVSAEIWIRHVQLVNDRTKTKFIQINFSSIHGTKKSLH